MRAAATVVLASPGGEFVVVRPGEEFPEWAEVTNPDAIAGGEAEADADTGGEAEADTDKDEPAPKRAPAKRTARATKPTPTE